MSYRLSSPAEAQKGLLLFVLVVLTAVGSHLPRESCDEHVRTISHGTSRDTSTDVSGSAHSQN